MKSEGINYIDSGRRELTYTEEFKKLIHDNPGVLSSFHKINDILKSKKAEDGEVIEEQGLKITVIGSVEWDAFGAWQRKGYYLKAEFAGNEFFVKTVPGYYKRATEGGGVEEFQSMQKARELLDGQSDIEVIDFQLGYQDTDCNVSYFVSKWVNAIGLNDYLEKLKSENTIQSKKEMLEILRKRKK